MKSAMMKSPGRAEAAVEANARPMTAAESAAMMDRRNIFPELKNVMGLSSP
jgi:hypothetical protein